MLFRSTPRGCLAANSDQATSLEGVFAAGDVASGPASIAAAVGGGRRAAFGAHTWLTGETARVYAFNDAGILEPRDDMAGREAPHVVALEEIYGISQYERREPERQTGVNRFDFTEINAGYDREQASAEAGRCFHCGHCKGCGTCVDDCPGYVLELRHAGDRDRPEVAFGDECWHCANCRTSCPTGAIGFRFPLRMQV